MAPTLRPEGESPPVYGADSDHLVHHGGFFVGHGANIDEIVNWFDFCEVDTWSPLWFDDLVEKLHYESSYSLRIYWLLPGKEMSDGLRLVSSDQDTTVMAAAVSNDHRNLVMYFDHHDNISGINWDDIVANPITSLPKVLSPSKMANVDRTIHEKLPEFYSNLEKNVAGEGPSGGNAVDEDSGSECDTDFFDSDYELDDEDDDLFMDNVDEDVVDEGVAKGQNIGKGKKLKAKMVSDRECDELSSDEDEMQLPESDDEGQLRMRFKAFKGEDLENPTFKVGMIFSSVEVLRKAIQEYSLKHRVEIRLPRNEQTRVRAVCTIGCPWNLYASTDTRIKGLMVKTFNGEHNCQKKWVLKNCTSNWLANKYIEHFRADQKMSLTNFARIVQKELNLTPPRTKLARARRLSMKVIVGDEEAQSKKL
ncbi:unnamed protein product [Urochloa humidicola]